MQRFKLGIYTNNIILLKACASLGSVQMRQNNIYMLFHQINDDWYQLYDLSNDEKKELNKCKNIYDYCVFFDNFFKFKKYDIGLRRTYALPGLKVYKTLNEALTKYSKITKNVVTIQRYFRGYYERRELIPNMMPVLMHPCGHYMKWKTSQIFT